jgi:hypothetical protein
MKYLKRNILKEKQLKMFPDYEKEMPDNPKEITHKYLNKRKSKRHLDKSSSNIKTWEDASKYFSDNGNITTEVLAILGDTDFEENFQYRLESEFYELKEVIIEVVSNQIEGLDLEKLEEIDSYDDMYNFLYDEYSFDLDDYSVISDIGTRVAEKGWYEYVVDLEYHDHVLSWISGFYNNERNDTQRTIYRAMTLPHKLEDVDTLQHEGVGIYWSYDNTGAVAHGGEYSKLNDIVLHAKVEPEDVNWGNTLHKSLYNLSNEMEIEVKPNWTIEITGFDVSSRHPIIKSLRDKDLEYFKALGIDNRFSLVNNKGVSYITFDTPIIVKTG